jgi:TolA-binding protein
MDKALDCYKTITVKLDDDGQSLIRFAGRAYDTNAFGTAIIAIDEYFKISKNVAFKDIALLAKARARMAAGHYNEALDDFRKLSSEAGDYRIKDEAGFSSGLIYAQHKGDCDSAMAAWGAMLRTVKDPSLQNRARLEMAVCHIKRDGYSIAESLLTLVAATKIADSSIERAVFLLGEISLFRGDFKRADDIFRQMVRQFPNAAHSNDALTRIDVIMLAGEEESSVEFLADFAAAMKAIMMGRPLAAAAILSDSSLASSPIAEQASFYSGLSFSRGNEYERAIVALRDYIDRFSDGLYTDRAYLEIGDICRLNPDTYADARAAYNRILELFPNGPVTEIARQRLRQLETQGKLG